MQLKKPIRNNFISIRVNDDELKQIRLIQLEHQKLGLIINRSKILRDVLLNLHKF